MQYIRCDDFKLYIALPITEQKGTVMAHTVKNDCCKLKNGDLVEASIEMNHRTLVFIGNFIVNEDEYYLVYTDAAANEYNAINLTSLNPGQIKYINPVD